MPRKSDSASRAASSRNSRSVATPPPMFRMPAEWEPHEATWLAWPHNESDWPGKFEPIPWVYCDIVSHLARHERVHIIAHSAALEHSAIRALERAHALQDSVTFHRWPTDRVWTRDYGPIFVKPEIPSRHLRVSKSRAKPFVANFQFNAWAKYTDWHRDEATALHAAEALGVRSVTPMRNGKRIVLEGGSIDVNGRGTLMTTRECLLSNVQRRNPGLSRTDMEAVFRQYLGISHTIWLNRGIAGDDTHGHIDDIARFVAPRTVIAAVETNRKDPNHAPLAQNLKTLRASVDQDGKRLDVVELPMPRPIVFRDQRLPASYANFYIANGLVLVPTFNDPNDRVALNTLTTVFPDRKVVGIHCGDLVWGLGTLHCMTQQQPR